MNANFGIILSKSIIETLLSPSPPEFRSWGGEEVQVGETRFTFRELENIEFQLFPVTEFIVSHLPLQLKCGDLVYAWMNGRALDEYEEWVRSSDIAVPEMHPFEKGLLKMIRQAGGATIMFAPEGERLSEFLTVTPEVAINLLRLNVNEIEESKGFMATVTV